MPVGGICGIIGLVEYISTCFTFERRVHMPKGGRIIVVLVYKIYANV